MTSAAIEKISDLGGEVRLEVVEGGYSAADDHVQSLLDQALFHADHLDRELPTGVPASYRRDRAVST